jgi:hypothetical protein
MEILKWQPVMLVLEKRMECDCGALAIFVTLDYTVGEDGKRDYKYNAWCQHCFKKAQDED